MSYIGIYPRNFLGKYYGRSINFQCFNCHLVSPKNYYIECHHCICERCVQKIQSCSSCVNQDIIIDGDNPTAFQFTLTEIMLNPYQMQCIFSPCEWQGTYQDFIKIHYRECKFKKNKRLMQEYLIEYNHHDYSHDKNKRSKSEIKIVKKNQKNKYLPVYNLNDSSDDDNIILDESSFDDKSNGLNLKNIEIEKGVNIDNNNFNNNKINTGITNRFSYPNPKIELKNDHNWLYDDDFDNGLNNIFTKRNSTNPELKKTLNIKKEIDNYDYNLIPKDLLNDKKGKNKKNNFDEIVINLSDDNEENEQSNEIPIDVEEQEEEEKEENENGNEENEEDNEIESYEIVDEEEEEKEDENENEEASYYLRKNDNKKKIYEKKEEKEEEEIEEEEDEEENDDNSQDEDYEDREVEEIEEDEYKESEEENSKRNRRREDNYRSKSYNYNFLKKKRNHENYRNDFGLDNYNIYKNNRGIKNNHYSNHKRWKF